MIPQSSKLPCYWCPECSTYYWGKFEEGRYLDGDHEEGTAENDIDWYTTTKGSACGCDEDDVNIEAVENYEGGWYCGNCSKCWGNDLPSATNCCEGQLQWGSDGKLRCMPAIPKAPKKVKS